MFGTTSGAGLSSQVTAASTRGSCCRHLAILLSLRKEREFAQIFGFGGGRGAGRGVVDINEVLGGKPARFGDGLDGSVPG
jgi:hypothetical protein